MKPLLTIALWLGLASAMHGATAQETAKAPSKGEASLTAEISEATSLARHLRDSADKFDKEYWIGSMFNEIDIPEHSCYALGMLLGFERSVRHLRFDRSHPRTARDEGEAQDLRITAQSLDNFEISASAAIRMSAAEREITWNLDCSGKLKIAFLPVKQTGASTFYQVTKDGRGVQILGDIEEGFTAKLGATLRQTPNVKFVALGSGGGSVEEALAAGRLIRRKGLTTTIWNNCYSACPLVFLGGLDRQINSPYPSFGFHQMYTAAGAIPIRSVEYSIVSMYIREMGVDSRFILFAMQKATPDEMNMINGADDRLCDTRIATWIQRVCEAKR